MRREKTSWFRPEQGREIATLACRGLFGGPDSVPSTTLHPWMPTGFLLKAQVAWLTCSGSILRQSVSTCFGVAAPAAQSILEACGAPSPVLLRPSLSTWPGTP